MSLPGSPVLGLDKRPPRPPKRFPDPTLAFSPVPTESQVGLGDFVLSPRPHPSFLRTRRGRNRGPVPRHAQGSLSSADPCRTGPKWEVGLRGKKTTRTSVPEWVGGSTLGRVGREGLDSPSVSPCGTGIRGPCVGVTGASGRSEGRGSSEAGERTTNGGSRPPSYGRSRGSDVPARPGDSGGRSCTFTVSVSRVNSRTRRGSLGPGDGRRLRRISPLFWGLGPSDWVVGLGRDRGVEEATIIVIIIVTVAGNDVSNDTRSVVRVAVGSKSQCPLPTTKGEVKRDSFDSGSHQFSDRVRCVGPSSGTPTKD